MGRPGAGGYSAGMTGTAENNLPPGMPRGTSDYDRIARAIAYLREHRSAQPALAGLAGYLGLSESATQRLFRRWAGISPKRFVQVLTVEHAKRCMARTGDLLSVSLDAGLSGPSRLHDLFVTLEALSPGEYRRAAAGLTIRYGQADTPFGAALVAASARGICHLSFVGSEASAAVAELSRVWPEARLVEDRPYSRTLLDAVFARPASTAEAIPLWVAGSNFQVQVWRALLRVPTGGLVSYGQLAGLLGRPGAARAVGSAVAANPVAYLIPCHRVLRESGAFGEYHWGADRKAALCAWEAAVSEGPDGRREGGTSTF